jgi:hypothetical protein
LGRYVKAPTKQNEYDRSHLLKQKSFNKGSKKKIV